MAKTAKRATRTTRTPRLPKELTIAIDAARSKKATDVTVLDLRKSGAFTDYFVVCTGSNPRQVHAIADAVEQALKASKVRPTHVEGYDRAEWVLIDYFDFVVHVFSPSARQFYGLERLWGNAARIEWPDEDTAASARV
jgi:ribosome-associated protein